MDANSGEPWSEMDIQDLRTSLDFGNTIADAATMLCRDEDEVRQKAKELGLVEKHVRVILACRDDQARLVFFVFRLHRNCRAGASPALL